MAEDPRNDDDFDTWEYGTEPLPHDQTWAIKKAPEGPVVSDALGGSSELT